MDRIRIINGKVAAIWTVLVLLFVLVPLVCIVFVSVSAAQYISFPWDQGFSLQWYGQIPAQTTFITGALHSLELAVLTAIISTCIGTLGALAVVRYSFRGRQIVALLGSSALFIPEVMLGLAILLALSASGMGGSFLGLIVGHVSITIPFVLRVTTAALTGFNVDQEFAAQNLGASRLQSFFLVTFPQIRSGIVASAVMAFIVSFDNVALSLFLSAPGYPLLPVALYSYAENSFNGIAAAVSVVMILISLLAIVILERTIGLDKLFGGGPETN